MSATRKSSPSSTSTSEEYSSSDEDQEVAQPTPSLANTSSKRTRADRDQDDNKSDSDSESDSESESDPAPPPKENLKEPLRQPPSPSSDEDEDTQDEEEQPEGTEEKPNSPVKQSKPDKKKLKASSPDQSLPKKSAGAGAGAVQRIWMPQDEIKLLQALSEYRASKGELPQEKDYGSFLATISGSIGFPVTEKQIGNKIRQMKFGYTKRLRKGIFVNLSKSHDKAVFELCAKVFEGGSKVVKKKEVEKDEANGDVKMTNGLGGAENGGVADVGYGNASSHTSSLGWLIEDVIKEQSLVGLLTGDTLIARIGESRAAKLEANAKVLKIDTLKLRAREQSLKADLLAFLSDKMTDD